MKPLLGDLLHDWCGRPAGAAWRGNRDSFAKATLKLLSDAVAASRMTSNARELMEQRFSWRFAASKFVELCQQAMDHQQRPS